MAMTVLEKAMKESTKPTLGLDWEVMAETVGVGRGEARGGVSGKIKAEEAVGAKPLRKVGAGSLP
jgi:hypothetical protein